MFNGIIQGIGIIHDYDFNQKDQLEIRTKLNLSDCKIGSSIACDGICLTLTNIRKSKDNYYFTTNISEETKIKSTTKYWDTNVKRINLEKPLKLNQEISGHFVYGHIDCISELVEIEELHTSWNMHFTYPSNDTKKFIVQKGSIAINGISLTIAKLLEHTFTVAIISHTYNQTNLSSLKIGDKVNLEFDMLARYIFNK